MFEYGVAAAGYRSYAIPTAYEFLPLSGASSSSYGVDINKRRYNGQCAQWKATTKSPYGGLARGRWLFGLTTLMTSPGLLYPETRE